MVSFLKSVDGFLGLLPQSTPPVLLLVIVFRASNPKFCDHLQRYTTEMNCPTFENRTGSPQNLKPHLMNKFKYSFISDGNCFETLSKMILLNPIFGKVQSWILVYMDLPRLVSRLVSTSTSPTPNIHKI